MPSKLVAPFRVPKWLIESPVLAQAVNSTLPANYNFELAKTLWRIHWLKARHVGLQMPEGLLLFALPIANMLRHLRVNEADQTVTVVDDDEDHKLGITILGDVTYGACCIDDYTAKALKVDLLVHYGHSCLIPLESPSTLVVKHFAPTPPPDSSSTTTANAEEGEVTIASTNTVHSDDGSTPGRRRIALVSTVQFVTSLHAAKLGIEQANVDGLEVLIPQSLPLSPGEILGCTSPKITGCDALIYLGDGRFHLESAMIANPKLEAFRYDPYSKKLTRQAYDHVAMRSQRLEAIDEAREANTWAIILGTLGRQGSPPVVRRLQQAVLDAGKRCILVLLSEISPTKLALFGNKVDAWIQVACPRLSIDWGKEFVKPVLTPFEASVALNLTRWPCCSSSGESSSYPMDYYAYSSSGPWTPNHADYRSKKPCRN